MTELAKAKAFSQRKCPHKKTDFRYELWLKERKAIRDQARKESFRVHYDPQPKGKYCVGVDTSKARSNISVVRLCLQDLGWREYPYGKKEGKPCDVYWHGVSFQEGTEVPGGKVNKFPGISELLRKISLVRTLDAMKAMYPDEYDFYPRSWFLPHQFAEFSYDVRKMNEGKQKATFIVKPDDGSQGDGIYLISDPREYLLNTNKKHIVQEYLSNPLLLENLKFDLRVYVVLAGIDPLEIHICREGLARFCTIPYQAPSKKNLNESYMHLTNYSLNKRSSGYVHTDSEDKGSKRTMSSVFRCLERSGYDIEKLWSNIEKMVVKTILSILPELRLHHRAEIPGKGGPTCFQILGFDILVLEDMKPTLLEVNGNPSLRIDYEHEVAVGICEYLHSAVDEEIKRPLIIDTLKLVVPKQRQRMKVKPKKLNPVSRKTGKGSPGKKASAHSLKPAQKYNVYDAEEETGNSDTPGEEEESDAESTDSRFRNREENSLEEIFPSKFGESYDWLRLMERTVELFIACLGVRGTLRMGSTGFRTFTRKCRLNTIGLSNAALDIMYIDLHRKWEYMNDERTSGLCYQGFLEAFFMFAKKKFAETELVDSVQKLLDYCEAQLAAGKICVPKNSTYSPGYQLKNSDK